MPTNSVTTGSCASLELEWPGCAVQKCMQKLERAVWLMYHVMRIEGLARYAWCQTP